MKFVYPATKTHRSHNTAALLVHSPAPSRYQAIENQVRSSRLDLLPSSSQTLSHNQILSLLTLNESLLRLPLLNWPRITMNPSLAPLSATLRMPTF